jgi:hypothetical protein
VVLNEGSAFPSAADNNIVPNKNSIASSNNDIRFSLLTDPIELKLRAPELRMEEKKIRHDQLNEKLQEIEQLEAFVKKITKLDPEKFKETIEETQRKIDHLIMQMPNYIQMDNQRDEFEVNLTIENLAKQDSYIS